MNNESIKLLRECALGCSMAINTMNSVLPKVKNDEFRNYLEHMLMQHNVLLCEYNKMIFRVGEETKEPSMMAKAMAKMTTEMKTMKDDSDDKIAKFIIDGCSMGIKQITEYKEEFINAESDSIELANRLINLEQEYKTGISKFI